jgi:hypothetical protein
MKDFNLTNIFCEVLSGLGIITFLIPLLDILNCYTLKETLTFIADKISLANFGILIFLCYILGLLFDAIGLVIGDLFLDNRANKDVPTQAQVADFWKNANSHVLDYRDIQWAYYSLYRNLFIISAPGSIVWAIAIWKNFNWYSALITQILFGVFEWILFYSMKTLLKLYYTITKSYR